jgi:hypothetical protein
MRMIGRIIGWMLILAALILLGLDLLDFYRMKVFDPLAAGELWYSAHRGSLNLAQAVVQRYLHPAIWDPAITWILTQPAFAVVGLPGVLLVVLCQRPRHRPRQPLFMEH